MHYRLQRKFGSLQRCISNFQPSPEFPTSICLSSESGGKAKLWTGYSPATLAYLFTIVAQVTCFSGWAKTRISLFCYFRLNFGGYILCPLELYWLATKQWKGSTALFAESPVWILRPASQWKLKEINKFCRHWKCRASWASLPFPGPDYRQ